VTSYISLSVLLTYLPWKLLIWLWCDDRQLLGLRYRLLPERDGEYGHLAPDLTWNGMIRQLIDRVRTPRIYFTLDQATHSICRHRPTPVIQLHAFLRLRSCTPSRIVATICRPLYSTLHSVSVAFRISIFLQLQTVGKKSPYTTTL